MTGPSYSGGVNKSRHRFNNAPPLLYPRRFLSLAGFLIGFGFPTGMRLASAISAGPTPWFWSINGAAGVLAASLAVVTRIASSIDTTLRIGAACYLLIAAPAVLLDVVCGRARH